VWEAAEPVNDVLVRQRVLCQLWIAQRRNEFEASGLCIGILLMLERQIEEEPLVAVERLDETFGDGRLGNGERLGVAGERTGGAAKHVAGELIEHNHSSKCRLRIDQQGIFWLSRDRSENGLKACANLLVKRRATVAAPEACPVVYLSIPIVIAVIVVLTTHVTVVMIASMITMATIVAPMT